MIARYRRSALAHPVWFGLSLVVFYAALTTLTYPVHFAFPETEAGQLYGDAVSRALAYSPSS